ncbi:MAG: PQQ-binding-like beta-propeller repeat protein [Chitinophagaceae bacterium]|nr:PQQ-binding-like beta-propeller repeat protein [Chitinophagaceae bacterium]
MRRNWLFLFFLFLFFNANAQWKPFRFAFISDTHVGSPDGRAEEDLRRTVNDINQMNDIDFVVITGDITELGMDSEIRLAKQILDGLRPKYYIIPGNHDAGWSESGGMGFGQVFGSDKFIFEHNGIVFLGCASGPYVRMSDGHIPRDAVNWMDAELKKIDPSKPVIFLNHYPIDNALDNWYEAIDRLKLHNTLAILCGHGHSNHALNFEGIPGVMGRSNLRAKAVYGGYNLVDVRTDSMIFSERTPGIATKAPWARVKLENHRYTADNYERPSYKVNDSFPAVKAKWTYQSDANVICTPAVAGGLVIFGNSLGRVDALSLTDGRKKWSFQAGNAVFSSPAVKDKQVVMGSADGNIYCLNIDKGTLNWKTGTGAAVLGSPLIDGGLVYIGGSDHSFRALSLKDGREVWRFNGLDGPVMSLPVRYKDKLIFGAWDTNLYAVDAATGKFVWTWNNGSRVRNYSPAACIPVIKDDIVYVVAPDRYISAIDANTGATLWRNNDATVRESIGISADGRYVYGKTMNDTIVAYATSREKQSAAWKLDCGFGYEHVPSMLVEKDGLLFFGTKNGRVYAVDPAARKRVWTYKTDNSMVNTVRALSRNRVIAATMDGKISLLQTE